MLNKMRSPNWYVIIIASENMIRLYELIMPFSCLLTTYSTFPLIYLTLAWHLFFFFRTYNNWIGLYSPSRNGMCIPRKLEGQNFLAGYLFLLLILILVSSFMLDFTILLINPS